MSNAITSGDLEHLIWEVVIPAAEKIEFASGDKRQLLIIAYYCSIYEQAWAILALIKHGVGTHAAPILRSQLEHFRDLKNLVSDPSFLEVLETEQDRQVMDTLVQAKKGNPYYNSIKTNFDVDAELSRLGNAQKERAKRGIRMSPPKDKFKKANLLAEANSLYRNLSDHAHGGLSALIEKHVSFGTNSVEVFSFASTRDEDFAAVLTTAHDITVRASSLVHRFFDTDAAECFDALIPQD